MQALFPGGMGKWNGKGILELYFILSIQAEQAVVFMCKQIEGQPHYICRKDEPRIYSYWEKLYCLRRQYNYVVSG